jgi:AraC-like DNA-binding protein
MGTPHRWELIPARMFLEKFLINYGSPPRSHAVLFGYAKHVTARSALATVLWLQGLSPYCGTGQLSFSVKHASPRSAFSRVLVAWSIRRALQSANSMAFAHRSPAHFSRKFKLAVGESPHAYAVRRRLERACYLMMTSAEPLSEIALSVGFSDQAHLCRLFRKAFGQSPANWRREREILGEVTTRTG